jgi:3-oxoacid CoA-transferase subunit A
MLEMPLKADFAFVFAWKGRLISPPAPGAGFQPGDGHGGAVTIASRTPRRARRDRSGSVVTPGIFVKHILQGAKYEKRIEKRTVR